MRVRYTVGVMPDSILSTINYLQSTLVWDALVVAVIFTGSIIFAFTLGRNSIIVSFVAVVFAGLVTQLLPSMSAVPYLDAYPEDQIKIGIFVLATIIFGIIFRRNRFFEPFIVPTGFERIIFACALAGLVVVMLGSFWTANDVSPYVDLIFLNPIARLAWLIAPVAMMAIFRGDNV